MQGSVVSRCVFGSLVVAIVLVVGTLAGASVTATDLGERQGNRVVTSGFPETVGLALDSRGNMYTADSRTGYVFVVPPTSSPVLLAKVPGHPAVLAVDRLRNVFVGTEAGAVYMVALDGSIQEAYRCDARLVGLDIDRDGGLVIAMEGGVIMRVERGELNN